MADLRKNNNCIACDYYDMEANDYYYQWCHHSNIDDEDDMGNPLYQVEDNNPFSDFTWYVVKCPIDGHNPYEAG